MVTESNPYICLGLMPGSSLTDIKRRYRQLAKQYHPDRNRDTPGSEEKLLALNAAYAFLSDPARKAAYDVRFEDVFNPIHVPQSETFIRPASIHPHTVYRRPRHSFWPVAGLTLLVLISTGAGILLTNDTVSPSLAGMLPQMPRTTSVSPDSSPQDFSFVPTSSPFDPQSNQDVTPQTSLP